MAFFSVNKLIYETLNLQPDLHYRTSMNIALNNITAEWRNIVAYVNH